MNSQRLLFSQKAGEKCSYTKNKKRDNFTGNIREKSNIKKEQFESTIIISHYVFSDYEYCVNSVSICIPVGMINPFRNARISTNHDKGLEF